MMLTKKYPYIVIEGPIGCGKTTLARKLADRFPLHLLLENAASNPFLPRFYQDVKRYALPTQLFFLFQRSGQVRELSQRDLFDNATVADFFLEKDPLFARLTLDDQEFSLYRQIYQHLQLQVPQPDLVIYLQTPVGKLLERIEQRSIDYEKTISHEYMEKLANAYSAFFHQYTAAPLLIVNNENLDVASNNEAFELLLDRIMQIRGRREYFNASIG